MTNHLMRIIAIGIALLGLFSDDESALIFAVFLMLAADALDRE